MFDTKITNRQYFSKIHITKQYIKLFLLLLLVLLLGAGCSNSNVPEEEKILDSEITFRDYEWYYSDKDQILKDLEKAYPALSVSIYPNLPFLEVNGLTIFRSRLDYLETNSWNSSKNNKVYLEGQPLKSIYVDYLCSTRRSDIYFKLVSGAYVFDGGETTFNNLKEYLTKKYGNPGKLKYRRIVEMDRFEYSLEDPNGLYSFDGSADYYEWHGQNNTVLRLIKYTSLAADSSLFKEEVFVRYYIPDGYDEYNKLVGAYWSEQYKKEREEREKNNGVL